MGKKDIKPKTNKLIRLAKNVVGWGLIVLGIILMPVPIVPGIIFVLIGSSIIGHDLFKHFRK